MGNVTSFLRTTPKAMSLEDTKKQIQVLEITITTQRRVIEGRRQKAIDAAVAYTSKNKNRAIHYVRLKKLYDKELAKLDELSLRLESYRLTLEVTKINADVVRITENTTRILRAESDAIDVQRVKEEFDEVMDDVQDIEQILYGDKTQVDDEDLERELQSLIVQAVKPKPRKDVELEMLME